MMTDDMLLPDGAPGPEPDAAEQLSRLGSQQDLQYFAGPMREVCAGVEELLARAARGPETGLDLDALDLLNRHLKAYLSDY